MKKLLLIFMLLTVQCFAATPIVTMMQNNFDSTTVTDISYPRDWMFHYFTANNTPTISTTIKKFGNGSLYCSANGSVDNDFTFPYYTKGAGDGETSPLGNEDWTIEFWVYIKQRIPIAGNPNIFVPIFRDRNSYQSSGDPFKRGFQIYTNINDTSAGNPVLLINGTYIPEPFNNSPTQKYITVTISQAYNTWYHVAVTKHYTSPGEATYRFFWNGSLYGYIYEHTANYPITYLNDPNNWFAFAGQLGGYFDAGTYPRNQCPMYFDDFRISRGCRYYTSFTPPTAPFKYPLANNLTFKPNGKINFKQNGKITMKFAGGF